MRVDMLMSEYVISIHSVVWLTTRPYPLPNRVRHRVRFSVSSFNFRYPVFSLRSCSNFLRHLFRLPVTSFLPSICPSVTCFWRQLLCKMRPIHLGLPPFIVCRIFLFSLTLCNTSFLKRSVQLIFILLQHHVSKHSRYIWSFLRSVQISAPNKIMLQYSTVLCFLF